MRNFFILLLLTFIFKSSDSQNVGIGTSTPDASAKLDISTASGGILIPRMTQFDRDNIASPATGLMIYQINGDPGFYYNAGTPGLAVWKKVGEVAPYPTASSNRIIRTLPGSTNFTVPQGITKIFFEVVGGGGGCGGGYTLSGSLHGGGGGGGGGFARGYISVSPGEVLTMTVGGPGINGTSSSSSPTNGTAGSITTITSGATTLIAVSGGDFGTAASAAIGGTGGNGGFASVIDTRTVLINDNTASSQGRSGPGATSVAGEGGFVPALGDFNRLALITTVQGSLSISIPKPYYGLGGGSVTLPLAGYVYLYW